MPGSENLIGFYFDAFKGCLSTERMVKFFEECLNFAKPKHQIKFLLPGMNNNYGNLQLRVAYWLFSHRRMFRKILFGCLIALNLLIWGFAVYQFSLYLIFWQAHQQTLKGLVDEKIDFLAYHQYISVTPLNMMNLSVVPSDQAGRYDLLAELENQNSYWGAPSFKYRFVWDGGETNFYSGYILPQERKYLVTLNQQSVQPIQDFRVEIENVKWQRIKGDSRLLLKIPSQIIIEDLALSLTSSTKKPSLPLTKLQFRVYNDSVYDLGSFSLNLLFYSGPRLIGINQIAVKELKNKASESFNLILSDYLSKTDRVKIIPDLNIFDLDLFIK